MFGRRRKIKKREQYRNLVFVEIEKHMNILEDDINYLKFILGGSDGMYIPLNYKIAGVKEYENGKILVTLANVNMDSLKEYLNRYDGVNVV